MLIRYSLLSLNSQRHAVIPTLLAIALAVGLVSAMTLVLSNVEGILVRSGRSDNVVFQTKGTLVPADSKLALTDAPRLVVLPGISQQPAPPGLELLATIRVREIKSKLPNSVPLRGVDPSAYALHDQVHILTGAAPTPGAPGVLVGVGRLGSLEGVREGGRVRVGRTLWPVVGTFEAPGTLFEGELWCDRAAMTAELKKQEFTALVARVTGPDAIAGMNAELARSHSNEIAAASEREINQQRTSELMPYISAGWLLIAFLIVGATFATMSTMQALLLHRRREFATLLAIGFTRTRVIVMVAFESLVMVATGAAIGFAAGSLLSGRQFRFEDWNLIVHLAPTTAPLAYSGLFVGIVAPLGVLMAVVQIGRMDVLQGLREG